MSNLLNKNEMNYAQKLAQVALVNKPVKTTSLYEKTQKKIRWGSHQYVRYVLKRCEELAKQGYGSVEIKIDRTADLFGIDEGLNSFYSHDSVVKLLEDEGFQLEEREDYYLAQSYILYWQVKPDFSHVAKADSFDDGALLRAEQKWESNKLPQAPNSSRIGMCWE